MTKPEHAPTLPTMVKPEPIIPVGYVMHSGTITCTNCGHESHRSQFYSLSYIRSRLTNERVRKLDPCIRPLFNLPVERVVLASASTPYCSACPSVDLSHLPPPPEASRVRTMIEAAPKGAAKPTPKRPSIFDLA